MSQNGNSNGYHPEDPQDDSWDTDPQFGLNGHGKHHEDEFNQAGAFTPGSVLFVGLMILLLLGLLGWFLLPLAN